MKFSECTKRETFVRQKGRCGVCGDDLNKAWRAEAYHIHPESLGGRDHVDNCVYLCDRCHHRVHYDGRYRTRIVAPKSYFRYWNGRG